MKDIFSDVSIAEKIQSYPTRSGMSLRGPLAPSMKSIDSTEMTYHIRGAVHDVQARIELNLCLQLLGAGKAEMTEPQRRCRHGSTPRLCCTA